ncbi:MAG: IPT/TIG domain-containing protein [Myxococcaceae bacterium]
MSSFRIFALAVVSAVLLLACGDKSPGGKAGEQAPAIATVLPGRGPTDGKTVAMIRGLNFKEGATVTFGAQAATEVRVVDAQTLTVVTPPGEAGAVNVTVASPGGQTTTFTGGFTYYTRDSSTAPPPSITAIQPNTGPASGGTYALLTGENLQDGALLFVGRAPASEVVVPDARTLSGRIAGGPVGTVHVEVTNPDGQTALFSDGFAFYGEAGVGPVISSVSPIAGTTEGGTLATLSGSGFKPGALVFFGGRPASGVTPGAMQLTALTPLAPPGVVDVVVTNPDGRSDVKRAGYNYYLGGPVILSVTPDFGPPAGDTQVTISGRNFKDRVIATIGGRSLTNFRRVDERTLTGNTGSHDEGPVDVTVLNLDGQGDTLTLGFNYGSGPAGSFSVVRVSPDVGPIAGGTRISLVGAGFEAGAQVSVGGALATSVQVLGSSAITLTTPPGAVGPHAVVVTQGTRTATLDRGFWYFDPAIRGPVPALSAVAPSVGSVGGGTLVSVSGAGFVSGARLFFGAAEATGVTLVRQSLLTAVTPAATLGAAEVRVQNPDGQVATLSNGFIFVDPQTLGPSPVLTAVAPSTGGTVDPTPVSIAAQNVATGALVYVGGVPASAVTVKAGGVDATFAPGAPGTTDVAITNPDGQTGRLAAAFTFVESAPVVLSVTPNTIPLAGGLRLLITGKGFVAGAGVDIGGTAVVPAFIDPTLLFATAPAHIAGSVDLTVTNPGGLLHTLVGAVTYADITLGNAPTLTSIYPAKGPSTGGTVALLVGTELVQGARVLFGSTAATGVTVMSATRLSAVAPAGVVGPVDISVINPDGQSAQLLKGFTYVDPGTLGTPPLLSSITPAQGVEAGGTQTVLTGNGFQPAMLVFFGGYSASAAATQNGGIATATTPPGPKGQVAVSVTNPDGQSSVLSAGYTYIARPSPSTIFPANGPTLGGTSFTLAGTGFASGARVFFDVSEATSVTVSSGTVITGSTPAHGPGAVLLKVQNPDGQTGTLSGAFTYNSPPQLTAARPGAGPLAGGTRVLVTGTGFVSGATVTFGATVSPSAQLIDSTQILATTPPGIAGRVDVIVRNSDGQTTTLTGGYTYDAVDFTAGRLAAYPDQFVSAVRDDAAYKTDLGLVNLSGAPVTVTIASVNGSGTQLGSRALPALVPPFGRTRVADVLQFIETATATVNRTASVVVQADGPVAPYAVVVDKVSNDSSVVYGQGSARAASRLWVPYASSVGAFKTWLFVRNAGTAATTVDVTARDASGTQLGKLNALPLPAGGFYSTDDVLGAMSVASATATLEVTGGTGAQLLAQARTYSNGRLGGMVAGKPHADASVTQTFAYVPDTSLETASLYLVNTETGGAASATLDLRTAAGVSLGTQTVSVPAQGFLQVPDLARTVLSKTQPTQTISSVRVTSSRALLALGFILTTPNSDQRFFNARPGGSVRSLLPYADARTGISVVNNGLLPANLELSLRLDSGAPRGLPLRLTLPSHGLFNAPVLLASLGAGNAAGAVEVRSLNGQPLAVVARVGVDPSGDKGDGLDLGNVLTTPAVDGVLPTTGPATGGTMASVRGAYFLPGATFFFGQNPSARSAVASDTVAVAVTPAGTVGTTVDLTVINFDGADAKLVNAFGYLDPATLGSAPAVASVTPNQVSTLGGTAIQINGSNFAASPLAFVGLTPVSGATQVNPSRVDGAAPVGAVGPADVTVTNPDGQSATLTGAVQYVVPPPSVTTLTPSSGPGSGGTVVRLAGAGFQVGATVGFGAVSAPSVAVLSPTEIEVTTPAGIDGPIAVTVANPDGQSVTVNNGYTYVAAPEVLQALPSSGPTAGGTAVSLTGRYFRAAATVTVGTNPATAVVVQAGGTVITFNTPPGSAGPAAVTVTNSDGQSGLLNNAFTYLAPIPPPTVTGVSPGYGPTTGGTQVTVQGSGFQAGAVVRFGTVTALAVTVISPSALTATVPGAAGPGAVAVTVTNPDTQSANLPGGFTYFQPADLPAIAIVSVTPKEGPSAGGNPVFVSGQGFKVGVTVSFGGTLSPTVNYLGPSALSVVAPPHALGTVAVTVTNPDSTFSTLANAYDYTDGVIFNPPPMRLPMRVERGYGSAVLFDSDNDGDLDAFLGRRSAGCDSDGEDQLWTNDGTGTFSINSGFPGDVRRNTVAAVVADFEGNGTKDVFAITNDSNVQASVWKNAPLSVFTRTDTPAIGGNLQQRGIALGDLNRDGRLDVYVATNGLDYWYQNNGQSDGGTAFTATRAGLPPVTDDSRAVCLADFDKDGDDDVFVVNGSNQQANYFLQGPAGTFTLSNTLIPVVGGNGTGCVAAELRPGSGSKDIVVVRDGQIYQYLKNNGIGGFADEAASLNIHRLPQTPPSLRIGDLYPVGIPPNQGYSSGIYAVDIDGDGDLDLAMKHIDTNPRIQLYVNDNTGFFSTPRRGRGLAT